MITGILAKFDPLLSDEVSVLIKCKPEHLHALVDLRGKEVSIQAVQTELQPDKTIVLVDILNGLAVIKAKIEKEL